jgi:exonuclease SbcC
LIRNEGLDTHEYKPEIITQKIENLIYIKAPNSSGKSTLLNIIALGLYGLNNKKIDPAIKKKLLSLSDTKHQTLNASFSIEDKYGNIELKSVITNGKPSLIKIENGIEQTMGIDRFENEYNLIYDIPTNPTERLKDLTSEIEIYQERQGNKIQRFSDYLHRTLQEISDSQDPGKVSQLESEVFRATKKESHSQEVLQKTEEKNERLKKYLSSKFLLFYNNRLKENSSSIQKLVDEQSESVAKKQKKSIASKKLLDNLRMNFAKINGSRDSLTKDLVSLLPTQDKRLKLWKGCDELKFEKIEEYASDFEEGDQLKRLSNEFSVLLHQENEKVEYLNAEREYEIFRAIIKFFEELKRSHKDEEIIIPGIDKSIEDFLTLMIEKNRENTLVHQKIELIGKCLKNLDEIINDIDALKNIQFVEFVKQKEHEAKTIDTPEKVTDTVLKTLREEEKNNRKKIEEYKRLCRDFEINPDYIENYYKKLLESESDLKSYSEFTEKQVQEEIGENEKNIATLTRDLDGLKGELKYKRAEIEKLKQKTVHPFHNDIAEITLLSEKTRILAQKFLKSYRDYLSDLKNQNPEKISNVETEKSRYYNELGKYFAKKTKSIIYNGTPHEIEFIDLIKEEILTKKGQKIQFIDFGTGESQATYLKSLLDTSRNDKRKSIILFDEVGMIDDLRLDQVIASLRKSYDEEKVLLGIIVQKGQKVEINKLI